MARVTFGSSCWKLKDYCLGSAALGGNLICRSGGIAWIASTIPTARNWYCRGDAVTVAEAAAACGDWFIPSVSQLQNPGFVCRTYWNPGSFDPQGATWSNCERNSACAYAVRLNPFFGDVLTGRPKTHTCTDVRAFRCVTY